MAQSIWATNRRRILDRVGGGEAEDWRLQTSAVVLHSVDIPKPRQKEDTREMLASV